MNFSVNYDKSGVKLSNQFYNIHQFDTADTDTWVELNGDEDGNYQKLVKPGDFGLKLYCEGPYEPQFRGETPECGLFVTVYDKDNAQERYYRIWSTEDDFSNLFSEELNADGTSKGPEGWEFDDLGKNKNIQPVKLVQEVEVEKDAKFCIRWEYSCLLYTSRCV